MSETKHTPGPWQVSYHGPSRPIILTRDHSTMLSISAFNDGRWTTYDNEEADARLIAAAPELLEACKGLLNQLANAYENNPEAYAEFMEEIVGPDFFDARRLAVAAIAKAENTL